MTNKIIMAIIQWIIATLITPAILIVADYFKLKRENKKLKEKIEKLKYAKTKADIDIAIDDIN